MANDFDVDMAMPQVAPVARLPVELLTEIFAIVAAGFTYDRSSQECDDSVIYGDKITPLMQVCKFWNQAVLQQPKLAKARWEGANCRDVKDAVAILKRPGGAPLVVQIRDGVNHSGKMLNQRVTTALCSSPRLFNMRWLSLATKSMPKFERLLLSPVPKLEFLRIHRVHSHPQLMTPLFNNQFSNLQSMELVSFAIPWSNWPCQSLTRLTLSFIQADDRPPTVSQLVEVLAKTPYLEYLHIHIGQHPEEMTTAEAPTVELHALSSLIHITASNTLHPAQFMHCLLSNLILRHDCAVVVKHQQKFNHYLDPELTNICSILPPHMQPGDPPEGIIWKFDIVGRRCVGIGFTNKAQPEVPAIECYLQLTLVNADSLTEVPELRFMYALFDLMSRVRQPVFKTCLYRGDGFDANKMTELSSWQEFFARLADVKTLVMDYHQGITRIIRMFRAALDAERPSSNLQSNVLPNLLTVELQDCDFSNYMFTFPLKEFLATRAQRGLPVQELVLRNARNLDNVMFQELTNLAPTVMLGGVMKL